MINIDSDTIGRAVPISDWITAMEAAFRDTAEGKTLMGIGSYKPEMHEFPDEIFRI